MRTNLINKNNFTVMKTFNLNRTGGRFLTALVFIFSLAITNAWGSATYKLQLKTVTQNNTGYGKVYATETDAVPEYSSYYTSKETAYSAVEAGSKDYYLWAVPTRRGVVFDNWTTSSTSTNNCTAGSSTLTGANKMQGAKVTVKAPTNASGTSTYTTIATVTANWEDPYSKAVVTYATPTDGKYRVTYEYSYLNTSTNALETGFTFDMDKSSAARVEDSYNNDVITLQSLDGIFEGWYNGSTLLSDDPTYTYVAPKEGGSVTISAHYTHVDEYYGKLTASIAEVPYSMPGGGTIFIADDPDATGTYTADAQYVYRTTYGGSQDYYLHAKPSDKRYVFRGWYSDAECTNLIHPEATTADYTYSFTASSTNSASPTLGNVYAAFDFNLYYMQVEVAPSTPGLGMVLVRDNNTGTPAYTDYASYSEQFLYAYRGAPTTNAYLYAKPKYGYKFSGWYDNAACTGTALSTENPYTYAATGTSTDPMNPTIVPVYAKFVEDATTVNITYNKPDQTKGEYTASVLDIAEVDDEYIWTFTEVFTSEGKTANTVQAQHKTDVLRLEATPKTGHGVTSWTDGSTTKTTPSSLYETTGTAAKTVGVTFGDAKPFLVCSTTSATTGTAYATLREAIDNLGSNKKIVIVQNAYVPAGNYIIPSGVTLLVPFDEEQTLYTTKPGITKAAPSGQSAYCTLTLASGANIAVNGAISVSAHQNKGQPYGGAVTGKYGKIELKEGSSITLNSGSCLYCWGYITGNGKVDALNGSNVYEDFQIACWRGGTAASGMNNNSNKVFPLAQYYIQNIEAKINFHYGSSETVYTGVTVSLVDPEASAKIIGTSDCLFQLKSGAILSRWFDASRDRQVYSLSGDATLGYVLMKISVTVDSRKYVLPLTNNMDIIVNSGTFTCDNDFAVLPGTSVIINEGAKVSLGSNCRMYVYDKSEWPEKTTGYNYPGNVAFYQIAYTDTKITTPRTYANMDDAKFDVNGTLEVNKAMYTTAGGANICSSKGTGNIVLKAAAGTETVTYQATQSSSNITYVSIPISAAKLHNGDGSYVATAGSTSGDKFIYSEGQDKWLKNPMTVTWNANDGTTKATTMAYSQDAFIGALPAAYWDGYTLEGWYTAVDGGTKIDATTKVTANITYYAHWTPKQYNITYMDEGKKPFSGVHGENYPTKHTSGETTNLVNPTKEGFIFDGWFTISNCKETSRITSIGATSITKDITLFAKWTVKSYTISFDSNGGSEVASITQDYGTVVTPPANPTRTGYTFDHWEPAVPTTMPASNTECVAQWTANTYFVRFNGNGATSGSMNNQSFTYDEAPKALTVNAFAKDGYSFDGWATSANGNVVYSDGQNVNNLSSEQNAVVDLYAKWRLYTITWRNMDGSLFETPNNPTSIEYDAKPAPPIENPTYSDNTHQLYVFTKWKAASDGHEYTTADLPNVTADETYTAQYDIVSELVVEGEQSISTETVVSTALLKVSGRLTVDATLTTDDLILEATPSSSGELVLVGKSNVVAENAYFEFSQPGGFKARTWYAVAVPWQVEANGGISAKKGDGDFASLQLGSKIDLIYYRGDIRAASGPINECWQYVEDDPSDLRIMQQGRAYMFCLYTPADIVRFARKSDPVKTTPSVKIYNSTTGKDNDANWNGIANPATYHAYINAYADEYQGTENAGQVYDADNKSYKVINLSTTQLLVGQPVFVQATTDSEIQVYANKPTSAPRRAKAQSTRLIRYEIQLVANDSEKADRIIVRMDEDKEKDEYVVGKDLIKMGLSSLVPQIYINRYGSAMCINTAKPIHDKAEYPLGIFAPEAGEYDIFVAEASNEDVNIYLTYNGKAIWNLAYGPYTIALDKGTTNSYGLRLSASAPQVTTGIEEAVVDAQGETRKVLINNHVFIIRGNNVYGIDGQLIK